MDQLSMDSVIHINWARLINDQYFCNLENASESANTKHQELYLPSSWMSNITR